MAGKIPQIFIANAIEDRLQVQELYIKLREAGYKPWLDKQDLLPGQNWRDEIPKALRQSDVFLACLSSTSIRNRGYNQKEFKMEVKMAIDMSAQSPSSVYLIPVKLDDCEIPNLKFSDYSLNLRDLKCLDYYTSNGFDELITAIEYIRLNLEQQFSSNRKNLYISEIQKSEQSNLEEIQKRPLKRGSAKGKIWLSDDFDEPLEDFKEYM